jgi:hypothetical protein
LAEPAPGEGVAVRQHAASFIAHTGAIGLEDCPNCGGELKTIAAILEQLVIEKILTHLCLQARAPPRAPPALRAQRV